MADYRSIKERWTRVASSANTHERAIPARNAAAASIASEPPSAPSLTPYASDASNTSNTSDASDSPRSHSRADGTFIGNGALFEGTLTLRGDFRIDTEFRGELETDGTITIEAGGSVVGSIRAREVVIRGAVVGNVTAPRQLIIESAGKLHGDIETACLEIQKHAFFQGSTSMSQPQAMRRSAADAPNSEATIAPLSRPAPHVHA